MSINLHKETKLSKQENSSKVLQQKIIEKFYVLAQMWGLSWLRKAESLLVEHNTEYKAGCCTSHKTYT